MNNLSFAIIVVWILNLLSIGFGYLLGRYTKDGTSINEDVKSVRKTIKGIIHPVKVGPVNAPSAETVNLWASKEETEEAEEQRKGFEKMLKDDI